MLVSVPKISLGFDLILCAYNRLWSKASAEERFFS